MSDTLAIEIDLAAPAWRAALPEVEAIVRRAAEIAWRMTDRSPGPAELSLMLTDDATVRELNRTHRGADRATNVLAFPLGDGPVAAPPVLLGDVVLAFGTVRREAARDGKPLAAHVSHLVVHGLLHLLGYDHDTAVAAEAMEAIEKTVLDRLGYADPYDAAIDAAE